MDVILDILSTGEVVGEHEDNMENVKEIFGLLGVDVLLVRCQVESIQDGQILDRDIKAEVSHEGADSCLDQENTDKESNTYGKSICSTNFKEEEEKSRCTLLSKQRIKKIQI